MSYLNATVDPKDRAKAAVSVMAIHAMIGAGVVLGLAVTQVVIDSEEELKSDFIFDPAPPPPPEPVETPPDSVVPYTPPAAPVPPVDLTRETPINVVEATDDVTPITRVIPRPVETPGPVVIEPPAPAYTPTAPVPSNVISRWITTDDYSRTDLIRNREGTAQYRLVVGSDGRVDACEITRSTGHSTLDRNTCRLIERRARFDPATNNRGEDVVGTYTGSVTWQIPD